MSQPTFINIIANGSIGRIDSSMIAQGEIVFTPPCPLQLGNGAGQVSAEAVPAPIVNGSIQGWLKLPNTAITSPENVGFTIKVIDESNGHIDLYPNVLIVADTNGNWDFATLNTGLYTKGNPVVLPFALTTNGISGAATYDGSVLNIPQYSGGSGSGTPTIMITATVALSAYTAVSAVGGGAGQAGASAAAIGIATGGALQNAQVTAQYAGPVTFNGWSWTLGLPVFVGANGVLTQTPPTSGLLQVVGYPLSATTLLIDLEDPISQ